MLTVREAAAKARVCEKLVRTWIASGQLAHFRIGKEGSRGKILVDPADLDALLASFKVLCPIPTPLLGPRKPVKLRHLRQPS